MTHGWGQTSPSVYETGRLVTLVPWLSGHGRRVAYLLKTQRSDGAWGPGEEGYSLAPTLSAAEALLSVVCNDTLATGTGSQPHPEAVAEAAARGLSALVDGLNGARPSWTPLPDMPAIELIVPSLVERINRHLAGLPARPRQGLEEWAGTRIALPAGVNGDKLLRTRRLLESGRDIPPKLLHALEVAGETAVGLPHVRPERTGTIGAAPAATAAWLGDRMPADPGDPARWHLETVVALHDGPVPCGLPLTVFERGWVLAWLLRSGLPVNVHPQLVLSLTAPLGPKGTAAAAGLPADADTTAGALYALALLGAPRRPDPLWEYEGETHFCTWAEEDGNSTTTNAHVIEAFGQYLASVPAQRIGAGMGRRYSATINKLAYWLCEQQRNDGSWADRWHASPYYATACCAVALAGFAGERSAPAVKAARQWVLDTQRADGSWGRWQGTAEETAYAVRTLLLTTPRPDPLSLRAVARGREHLAQALWDESGALAGELKDEPALWHDKDLYRPTAIVRAAIVASLHLAEKSAPVSGK
ncbi:prenyltransferase/squalene oxidase repeat-containing protein [Spirillospora sp. NPDC048911]|uniref:prenyltransferase/squalene oxidase repeat-containing protein n=1 Tax=Spirillospora sp. NPDC048911 TaxID=3364527 RepID=UPI003719546A